MKKYTIVDKDTCISCGSCGATAPDIFGYDNEGVAECIMDNNKGDIEIVGSLIDDLIDASESCPTGSIKIKSTPFEIAQTNN